jgi:iron donor protein CyaY
MKYSKGVMAAVSSVGILAHSAIPVRRANRLWYHRGMASTLSDQEFSARADEALESLQRGLLDLADREGFEVELQGGVVNVFFEEPTEARFVVSPNAPVRQIWVSALVRSYKLSWSDGHRAFELDGEPLAALIERLVHIQLGR